jgi:mRNA-degrading endonuclease RelE of RelBE toxin-antitoxin system
VSQVRVTQHCRQQRLPHLPKQLRSGFIKKLRVVSTDPNFGKPLSGELKHYHSLRLGRYRIIYLYEPVEDIVWVVSVGIRKAGSRDDVYEQLLGDLHAGRIALEE